MDQADEIKRLIYSLRNEQIKPEVTPEQLQELEKLVPPFPMNLTFFENLNEAEADFKEQFKAWMDKNATQND